MLEVDDMGEEEEIPQPVWHTTRRRRGQSNNQERIDHTHQIVAREESFLSFRFFFQFLLLACIAFFVFLIAINLFVVYKSYQVNDLPDLINTLDNSFPYMAELRKTLLVWLFPSSDEIKYNHKHKQKNREKNKVTLFEKWIKNYPSFDTKMELFTDEDLVTAKNNDKLYLVLIGHVFDVTEGKKYYGSDSGYGGFVGRDGSRAFVSGQFDENGLTSDIHGLSNKDYLGLVNWLKFYMEHDTYKHIGNHVGRFFDKDGKLTEEMLKFRSWLDEAELEKSKEEDFQKEFPPCNVEWSAQSGTSFWCSTQSGGIKRSWKGVPREFFEGDGKVRCACIKSDRLDDPRLKIYEGCPEKEERCNRSN